MPAHSRPRRGEVWMVSLDPTKGHEIKKTRPAVVVTNDVYNTHNWVVIVMPLTSHDHAEYDQVLIEPPEGGLTHSSVTLQWEPKWTAGVAARPCIVDSGMACLSAPWPASCPPLLGLLLRNWIFTVRRTGDVSLSFVVS